MTILAAFQILIRRYSDAEEILIGAPIANRPHSDLDRLIGNFINIVSMRCDTSGNPTFAELLQRSRETTLHALFNKDIPFETIVRNIKPHRDPSRNAVFQTLLQVLPAISPKLGDLSISPFYFELKFSQMDLILSLYEEANGSFLGRFQYCSDLFESSTIKRLAHNFVHLLNEIVRDPLQNILDVPILAEAERMQVLEEWNQTQFSFPEEETLHALVEKQANETPELVALEFDHQRLTYRELNHRSNGLARRLQSLGVKPNVLVGISFESPLEMVIALLGTLKAGGAYVPMDPAYPRDRLAFMMEDASLFVLLTEEKLKASFPTEGAKIIYLDSEEEHLTNERDCAPDAIVAPHDLAYIIYTSGSTGRPKGVEIAHRGLCNMIAWQTRAFRVDAASRVLQFASFSFDASVSEVFMALTTGATLVLRSRKLGVSPSEITAFLREASITHATFPPSLLAILPADNLPLLQTVISAGEACSSEVAGRWSNGRKFYNAYGPTEATVCVSSCLYENNSETLPIGRPIQNTQLYVLERNLQPSPIGVPGELHAGGVGLARGYLNRPGLTREKFIPNPFSPQPGARLYKTGDLCRRLSDGNIEYLGRLDQQVKLRGFRIELGEIEDLLRRDDGIREAAVVLRDDRGEKRLVAYCVNGDASATMTSEGRQLVVARLSSSLRAKLPDYMLPSAFVFLESLPVSANGKLDRQALPAPDWQAQSSAQEFVAPGMKLKRASRPPGGKF